MRKLNTAKPPKFIIPDSFFERMYEFTGQDEGNRGFIITYVSPDGSPIIYNKVSSSVVEMGLRKAMGKYLDKIDELEQGTVLDDED